MARELKKKKLTALNINLAKQEPGYSFQGKYLGTALGEPFQTVDQKTGEVITKALTHALFERPDGERVKVIADAGLKSALTDAMVKEGQLIEVVKLAKTQLSKGRTMNQYDVFSLE